MDPDAFKEFAKEMAEYITNYLENIRDRRVLPTVEPGYMKPLLPSEAPQRPESWKDVMADIEKVIMPGVTHWHSPKFHAYFPTAQSYPAIVADMLSGAIACIGFTWIASPACTELEVIMLDWLGKMLDLPKEFLACSGGKGGGVIQGTASEATLVALLGAKARKIRQVKEQHPDWTDNQIVEKLIAYSSCQAHSSVERAGLLGGVKFRLLEVDSKYKLRGETLAEAIRKDKEQGLIPFYHWQIPLGRRFRALKLWFVLRIYGVENLQRYIRNHVAQAHEFEALVLSDPRFEIVAEVILGLVCFRLKGSNDINETLLKKINGAGNIHLVPSKINDMYFLRFAVCSRYSESKDIQNSWKEIKLRADEVLEEQSVSK